MAKLEVEMKIMGNRLFALVFLALLSMTTDQMCANNLLNNGSFQTGDFTSWMLGSTANGTAGVGFPIVTTWPLGGSNAAQYEVGQINYVNGDFEGAMLLQGFAASGGTLDLAFDWAAMGDGIHNNSDAGLFQLVLDGLVLNSYDVGHIGPKSLFNGTLSGTASVAAGMHFFEIDILRPFQSGQGSTPYEFITGASVSAVPEPSSLLLLGSGIIGIAGVLRRGP